jgi:polyisoprenoid-binding protein YceI
MRWKIAMVLGAVAFMGTRTYTQTSWVMDKNHSAVKFSVAHLVISEVSGLFKDFDVALTTSADDFSDARLSAMIKTASISTENDRRDAHLRSGDFLDVAKFPELTFVSDTFRRTGPDSYDVDGKLTLHGITKPVTLHAVNKGKIQAFGRTTIVILAQTKINRFDYEVKWDKKLDSGGLIAGDSVKIDITYEGQITDKGGM